MYLKCLHYAEIKKLPENFDVLASSEHSKIEAIKHKQKTLYGFGFHAEKFEMPYMDGKKILENFSNIVNDFWEKKEKI